MAAEDYETCLLLREEEAGLKKQAVEAAAEKPAAGDGRVRSHRRFGNRGIESLNESVITYNIVE